MRGRFVGIRRVLSLRNAQSELDEELAFHRERTLEELVERGMSRDAAEVEARRRFGDERRWRKEIGSIARGTAARRRAGQRLEAVAQDLRYAVRRIVRSPGLAAAIVVTFALGIGANATMFGIIDRLLLSPPPGVVDADAVKRIYARTPDPFTRDTRVESVLTYPDYRDFQEARAFSGVAGWSGVAAIVGRGETAEEMEGRLVTGNFFGVLGATPAHGRLILPGDDVDGGPGVAVISHRLWQERYGGSAEVVGETIDIGYGPFPIVGVAPERFNGVELEPVDVWFPMQPVQRMRLPPEYWESMRTSRRSWWINLVGRLAPDANPETAAAELTTIFRRERGEEFAGAEVLPAPLLADRGPRASGESVVARWLLGVSLVVLLIACANVANLLLARSIRHRREIGIRLALGVARGRLLGQMMAETLILAVMGGAAALLVAHWGGSLVRNVLFPEVAWPPTFSEPRMLLFVALAALVAGLGAGLLPALQAIRPEVLDTLRAASPTPGRESLRARSVLTVVQAGLSVTLLVGAGLFLRSLDRVNSVDLGMNLEDVQFVRPVFTAGVSQERQFEIYREAEERLAALPGVEAAAASVGIPFRTSITTELIVPGVDSIRGPGGGVPYRYAVGPGYFSALGIPVRRGRGIGPKDVAGAPPVAVINETMARSVWPEVDPLGQCFMTEENGPCIEVVGVVPDVQRQLLLEDARMQYFLPLSQESGEAPHGLVVRLGAPAERLTSSISQALLALGEDVRFVRVTPYHELVDPQRRSWVLGAAVFSAFGILALIVAGVGLFSVLAFEVGQRTREIGIRSALGASRERLLRMILGDGVRLAALGVVLGIGVSLLAGPKLEPLLYETSPRDPVTIGLVALVLLLVAALASSLPAWRATRIDPATALRED